MIIITIIIIIIIILTQQIKDCLEANKTQHNAQHGFRTNRSTTSNMLICDTKFSETLNERIECHVIMIDFKGLFDKTDHSIILIAKLSILVWIAK